MKEKYVEKSGKGKDDSGMEYLLTSAKSTFE
jgi:hypothetical protein